MSTQLGIVSFNFIAGDVFSLPEILTKYLFLTAALLAAGKKYNSNISLRKSKREAYLNNIHVIKLFSFRFAEK